MNNKKYSMDMTKGPILSKILFFALPLMASSILQLLFNAADMIVAGRFVGASALAAIGSTSSLINLLVNVFMGLSVGANVLVARYFGSGQHKDVHETVHTAIMISIISGIMLTFIGIAFAPSILKLMGTPEDVLDLASLYIRIYFAGMPLSMLYNFGSAILRAIGDTKRPLVYLTISGSINAVCNVGFIVFFHMGVEGVAIATVISQGISAVLIIRCLIKSDESYKLEPAKLKIYKSKLVQILKLGLPAGFQGAIFSISNVLIQSSINSFGSQAMAGNSAAVNIEGFVYVSMNAFHHAALSFTSQNYGAHEFKRIKKICITSLALVTAFGFTFGMLSYIFSKPLLSIYVNAQDADSVLVYGVIRMSIIMVTYFTCGTMDVMVGCIRGLGYSVLPMIVSLLGVCGFRIVWIFTRFASVHTLESLFWSYPISWTATTIVHLICFIYVIKKVSTKNELMHA